MATSLPYLDSYKNVSLLFDKIQSAKTPDSFTHKFLSDTLGLKSTGDRRLINLLKALKFLDTSGAPTQSYGLLKNATTRAKAIGLGVKEAYEPLFAANVNTPTLSSKDLRGLIAQVAGSDDNMTNKILGTLNSLIRIGDFESGPEAPQKGSKPNLTDTEGPDAPPPPPLKLPGLRPEFHYNIQIHLPSNATEETYTNIFGAMRKVFK